MWPTGPEWVVLVVRILLLGGFGEGGAPDNESGESGGRQPPQRAPPPHRAQTGFSRMLIWFD